MTPALQRYRIASYIVGVLLLLLCAEIYANHVLDNHRFGWIAIVHGWFYMIYLGIAFGVYKQERWPAKWALAVVAAGLVPGMVFFVERKVVQRATSTQGRATKAGTSAPAPQKAAPKPAAPPPGERVPGAAGEPRES